MNVNPTTAARRQESPACICPSRIPTTKEDVKELPNHVCITVLRGAELRRERDLDRAVVWREIVPLRVSETNSS